MTLIMSVAYKDEFVFITSDSRVIKQHYRLSDFKRTDKKAEKADISFEKVIRLTDYVLFSSGGNAILGELIEVEMKKRLKSNSDLAECTEILKDIIKELRSKKGEGRNQGLLDKPSLSLNFLDSDGYFGCCMVGFYQNGRAGMTTFGAGKDTFPEEIACPDVGYPVFMFAPTLEYEEMKNSLFDLPAEYQKLEYFLNAAVVAHTSISYVQQDAVSPDCNIFMLVKEPSEISPKFIQKVVDTEPFYERISI